MSQISNLLNKLIENKEDFRVHEKHMYGTSKEEFMSGYNELNMVLRKLYSDMEKHPKQYAMKDNNDIKGFYKNINFLMIIACNGELKNDYSLEIDGEALDLELKNIRFTKPELYFDTLKSLGFVAMGLKKKVSSSDTISVEYPDNHYLIIALKAMGDCASKIPKNDIVYFMNMDYRILENEEVTSPKLNIEYILRHLAGEKGEVLKKLNDILSKNSKCVIDGDTYYDWNISYKLKSNKKAIALVKSKADLFTAKLNLRNIGNYINDISNFPEKLKNEILTCGWSCGSCNVKCEGGYKFDYDGVFYDKCRCGSFIFDNPNCEELEYLIGLFEEELNQISN